MRLTKKREKKINNATNTKEDMAKGTSELKKKQNVHQITKVHQLLTDWFPSQKIQGKINNFLESRTNQAKFKEKWKSYRDTNHSYKKKINS